MPESFDHDAADFRDFLTFFPEGELASSARQRLHDLELELDR